MEVAILGAGVAGIAAASHLGELGISATIYEQEETYGGLCNSFQVEGFTFDTFAHISFDPDAVQWMEDQTDFLVHRPEALNYAEGTWLRHPVQMNLHGLPVNDRIKVLKDFIYKNAVGKPSNYGEWLKWAFGEYFAEKYPYRYTRKYWTVGPELLETKWITGRMYEPNLEEMLRGAMTDDTPSVHYSKEARYPKNGGFKAFLKYMADKCHIVYNKKAEEIDIKNKKLIFQDKTEVHYDRLISTIPLPELCFAMKEMPTAVRKYADELDYTSGIMVSLGFNRPKVSPSLWYYIYDEDIWPARIYAPEWKSPNNVPKGCSAIQAEIYYSKYKPLFQPLEAILELTIEQLLRLGLFEKKDIILKDIRKKKYANIMFTPQIYTARDKIHEYLDRQGIVYAGRFGEWDYLWVGQSLLSGRRAADQIVKIGYLH